MINVLDDITLPGEEWRKISIDADRYYVSNLGRVGSRIKGLLALQKARRYPSVYLQDGKYGTSYYIHKLVMLHFVGPRPAGMVIHHINGDMDDNRLVNLVYMTMKEHNEKHRGHVCICPLCGMKHQVKAKIYNSTHI